MPTLVAIQQNPRIKAYYHRLLENGKNKRVAVAPAMRKILVILNSMAGHETLWNKDYA